MFMPMDGVKHEMERGCKHFSVDDSREDMEALLEVIYGGLRIDTVALTAESFPLLSSLLQMCTKYEIERPRSEVIARIQANWPHDLAKHDAIVDARIRRYMNTHVHELPQNTLLCDVDEDMDLHPAAVISLLRQCGYTTPELLAALFYALSRCSKKFGGTAPGFSISPLSHADIERLIVGIERLREAHSRLMIAMPLGQQAHMQLCGPGLLTHNNTQVFPAAVNGLNRPIEFWRAAADKVQRATQGLPGTRPPCAACCDAAAATIRASREALWGRMAEIFELA
ncbi:uncharacterized protein PHACADRAFT_254462 [Phanerochaete carnosa HHB-10118-sp]|uniref:BTB domain-containing protein n=1 Tax=Phanerochaete carnosa (strain HHB-10118-sp) TaxID=650164 RepID=K5X2H5_PHACS|nr:uncharacterized protein PHACADRAFT_254462 [Phanerochaete carnosa HHB-10118-sp]EKM57002.1 hypothetical protein PHACADRAFT_254462 [Phanerochaete carnosa HHB-10118-sp]